MCYKKNLENFRSMIKKNSDITEDSKCQQNCSLKNTWKELKKKEFLKENQGKRGITVIKHPTTNFWWWWRPVPLSFYNC